MNPLTDELPDDVKAELAAMFRDLKRWFPPMSVAQQRFLNKTWSLYR